MGKASDEIARLAADLSDTQADLASLATGVTTLINETTTQNTLIANLQAQLANLPEVSPDVQTALDAAVAQADVTKAAADAAAAELPATPAPPAA